MACNSCNNMGFGNSWWWIILLVIIFCGCGNNGCGSNGCDNNCGC